MRSPSRWALLVVITAFAACTPPAVLKNDGREGEGEGEEGEGETCGAETDKPSLGAGAVYFGTREPSHVILDAAQKLAVVGVGTGAPPGSECSGTLITDDVVLTATHCTEGQSATRFYVTFGDDDFDPVLVIDVIEKTEHPELDIAMLRLASAPAAQIDIRPIPAFSGDLLEQDAGELFEQAGFGQTESGDSNGLFFVAEPFDSFEEGGYLVVDGEGRHGVCFGDSGGPSLRQTAQGGVRVMGALSYGDPECTGFDRYTRVDLARDWLEDFAGPIPGNGPVPCGAVTSSGRCTPDGRVAEFCDANDVLVRDPCGTGEVCGDGAGGLRCIAVAANPCGDVTAFGGCEGNVLAWCDDDVVRVRDCGDCGGEVCARVDNVVGFACVEDACNGITFQGECNGSVARWCEDNVLQTQDCRDTGETCGFVDDETGFFCQ
ncbi:MAG: trypsin-like serine protease [Deltaproteobacteria bacterium]|nr:trypsin-like serine protease [Deltaproteobacteria bacterium]